MPAKKPTLKPAAQKLPLAVRKNIRDEWEAKKPEYEQSIHDLLGEQWTITTNPLLLYTNTSDDSSASRLGSVLTWYFEPVVANIKTFVEKYGDDGKSELNSTVTKHVIDFSPQDSTDFTYGGLVVEDGVLRLVYKAPDCFGTNVDYVSREIAEALVKAGEVSGKGKAYDVIARNGVKDDYEEKIEEVQEKIAALVGVKDIKLTPNFESNAEVLQKAKDKVRNDWPRILGQSTLEYFDSFAYQLKQVGFEGDDMLQEGFQEGVPKNEIAVRVVEKLVKGSYNEAVIEDGTLYLQTTADNWWTNVSSIGSKILEIL